MPKPNFLIAVFSQPVSSFDKWIGRGINALVSHEPEGGRVKKSDWEAAAAAKNLYFLDYPSDDDDVLQNEAKQTRRLAFMQDDEPDLTRDVNNDPQNRFIKEGPFKGWTRPELLVHRYQRCKAASGGADLPVFCNFAGPQITVQAYTHGLGHKPYLAAADWLAHDWYVKNKNHARYPVTLIAMAMDRLEQWWKGTRDKGQGTSEDSTSPLVPRPLSLVPPQFVFIECSDQKISPLGRCPTPDEVEESIDLAVARGARGIIYFPQRPPPGFQYDAMPPDIVERIVVINDRVNRQFNQPDPPTPTPPAPDQPTARDLLTAIQSLRMDTTAVTSRLDSLAQTVDALRAQLNAIGNRGFRASIDLRPESSTSTS